MAHSEPRYDPPPDYSPSPAPRSYGPESFGAASITPPRSTRDASTSGTGPRKPLATAIGVVIALVMCGCAVSVALAVMAFSVAEDDTGTVTLLPDNETAWESDRDSGVASDTRTAEWLAWDPPVGAALGAPPEDRLPMIDEGMAAAAPGLTATDIAWRDGYYDAEADWFYADLVLVRGERAPGDRVFAAVELYLQSDQMVGDGIAFQQSETDSVTTVADGERELLYRPQWTSETLDLSDPSVAELWTTVGADWPDSVVMEMAPWAEGSDTWYVKITTWRAYAIDEISPHVYATYEDSGDGWSLLYWEYRYPGVPAE